MSIKTVKINNTIHVVTYACGNKTLCNKSIPENPTFVEKKSLWETTCNKCKKILSPLK